MSYILALDQGTTSSRAILFDSNAAIVAVAQKEFRQIFPKPGWVEHDPQEIWETQQEVLNEVVNKAGVSAADIVSIGITNQRETVVVWDSETGEAVHNAIVWQDTRTSDYCKELKQSATAETIHAKTGLIIDSYFSATKLKWILENVPLSKKLLAKSRLMCGTIDSWLVWNLTNRRSHITDHTNASRTMLFNIHHMVWDQELLDIFEIPHSILPEVRPSMSDFGIFEMDGVEIPINGIAGDQQAALFGQQCFKAGQAKNTYGTGCFLLMNTGETAHISENGLLTTIGCGLNGPVYALEGSIFIAGAAVQWLRDGLQIITDAAETEDLAKSVTESDVYMVPAFAGLGAPYWDMHARGALFGLTRDTGREHLVKATLESLAYQTRDVVEAMEKDSGVSLSSLNVDGGATANNYLMQFQSDILGREVVRPKVTESTAQGAALLAGLQSKFWTQEDVRRARNIDKVFTAKLKEETREKKYKGWKAAVKRSMGWIDDIS